MSIEILPRKENEMDKDKTITITLKDAQIVAAHCALALCDQEVKKGIDHVKDGLKKSIEASLYYAFMITSLFDDEEREKAVKMVSKAEKKYSGGDALSLLDDILGAI